MNGFEKQELETRNDEPGSLAGKPGHNALVEINNFLQKVLLLLN